MPQPLPPRIFFDTNIYIVGAADPASVEAAILNSVGYDGRDSSQLPEILISAALLSQIVRVGRRLYSKDWASQIVSRIWYRLRVRYVLVDKQSIGRLLAEGRIPREDVDIYLAALYGKANLFVSNNRELVRKAAAESGQFTCLTPDEFAATYF